MIQIVGTENCSSSIIDELQSVIEDYSDDYEGTIELKLKATNTPKISLSKKWKNYCKRAYKDQEDPYITSWSPNNSSEIGKLMKKNSIIESLTDSWYQNYDKHQSVDMLEILDGIMYDLVNMDVYEFLEEIEEGVEHDEEIEREFFQTLEVFYNRNPRFRYDW